MARVTAEFSETAEDTGNPVDGPNDAERAIRDEQIWQLRLRHLSLRTIAARMGLPQVVVWQAIRTRIADMLAPLVCEVVAEEDARLEFLFEQLLPGIEGNEVQAIDAGRKISESRRRLYGADGAATVNMNVTEMSASDVKFMEMAARAEAQIAARKAKSGEPADD